MILQFPKHRVHARTSIGYKSGRSSWRGTPDSRSTASTLSGGTSSHCDTACVETPSSLANLAGPPAASIARCRGSLPFLMIQNSSITLPQSQASLPCGAKALLYTIDMTLGKRMNGGDGFCRLDLFCHFGKATLDKQLKPCFIGDIRAELGRTPRGGRDITGEWARRESEPNTVLTQSLSGPNTQPDCEGAGLK